MAGEGCDTGQPAAGRVGKGLGAALGPKPARPPTRVLSGVPGVGPPAGGCILAAQPLHCSGTSSTVVCVHIRWGTPAPWGQIPLKCKLSRLNQEETGNPRALPADSSAKLPPTPEAAGPEGIMSPLDTKGRNTSCASELLQNGGVAGTSQLTLMHSQRQDTHTKPTPPCAAPVHTVRKSADPCTTQCPERPGPSGPQ